ncbi:MAG: 1-acyl-sn-glycerol-3-phosphate acyltransferase [Bacteroidota bacterium]
MLYYIIRPLTYLGLLAFCKKIYLTNTKSIPKDRPVILACNHPTAFLEPCILASFTNRPLHFLVRGDFFKHSFYRKLMYSLHLIPIYRSTNANYQELKRNIELMDIIGRKLNENITLMILVEGSASVKKGLRPIQKGIARLAFDVYEQYGRDDLEIIPVGANFDDPTRFRMTPMINFGQKLAIKDYRSIHQTNKKKAIRKLMQDIEQGMRNNIIHVEDEADTWLVEQQLLLLRNESKLNRFPIVERQTDRLEKEVALAAQINQMTAREKQLLQTDTKRYFRALADQKLRDSGLFEPTRWWHLPLLILGFPIFAIGTLFNGLPPYLGNTIAQKKVKRIQYVMPVAWGISNLSYAFYWLLLLLLASMTQSVFAILLVLALPFMGYFAIVYYEILTAWRSSKRWEQCSDSDRTHLQKLRAAAVAPFGR